MDIFKNKYVIITLIITFISLCLLILFYSKKKKEDITYNLNYIKYADDITKMNKTIVDNVFNVLSIDDIIYVVNLAKKNNKKLIARGESHSMGGQTVAENGYIVDTKYMNHILEFDPNAKTVTVEPGITWFNLIYHLNLYGYSPEILQSYASFSVGGSVSVNIHGITSDNVLCKSIVEIELIDSNGNIILCNKNLNNELFFLVIGGYGLFGIITKVKLRIINNKKLNMKTLMTNINNFQSIYAEYIDNKKINIKIARINITNMEDINLYLFTNKQTKTKIISRIDDKPKEMSKISQLVYKWILPNENVQKIRFDIEKMLGKPLDINDDTEEITRNAFLYESAKPLATLYSPFIDINKTHILQEFFIPNDQNSFIEWMKYLKEIFIDNKDKIKTINLLNITIRYVLQDDETFLRYAKKNMYAFVFYYRIDCDKKEDDKLRYIHNLLVNKTLQLGGTFYLPYRHHYSYNQMELAYPNINEFFKLKRKYDPDEMFWNMWYKNYGTSSKIQIPINTNLIQSVNDTKNYKCSIVNSYQYVLSSKIWKNKLKRFLVNIFNLLPYDELFKFIDCTFKLNNQIDNLTMFIKIKEYVKDNYTKLDILYGLYNLVNKQQENVSKCLKELLLKIGVNYPLNNYVSFGDSGKYISAIKDELNIQGNIYIVNDTYSYLEQFNTAIKSTFIQYNYNKMNKLPINDIELVTCLIGLHHFKKDKLILFIQNVYNMLKPNGFFIIREHHGYCLSENNYDNNIVPLLICAHSIFNAVTGESLETEKNEIRDFKSLIEWRQIIESVGFKDMRIYTIQENDPTENLFICFMKPDTTNNVVPLNLKSICYKNENYKRSLCQSYLTIPEWFSVDVIKEYGNFLEHTPWYDYPYGKIIMKYWGLWLQGICTSIGKCGFKQTLSSWSYTLMNCIIGILLTIVYIQLGLLAMVPSFIYHLPGNNEIEKIQMIIYTDIPNLNDFNNIDDRIKIINNEKNYYIIEIPRYKQFTDIMLKLIMNKIEIIEIAGQTEIQVKILLKKTNLKTINNMDYVDILYDYAMFDDVDEKNVVLSIKIDKIHELIKNNIDIKHIYDY